VKVIQGFKWVATLAVPIAVSGCVSDDYGTAVQSGAYYEGYGPATVYEGPAMYGNYGYYDPPPPYWGPAGYGRPGYYGPPPGYWRGHDRPRPGPGNDGGPHQPPRGSGNPGGHPGGPPAAATPPPSGGNPGSARPERSGPHGRASARELSGAAVPGGSGQRPVGPSGPR
jgi:hypothetical protein